MEINKYIDSTNLKADATLRDIEKLCNDAMKYHFATVCVNPYYVKLAVKLLENSNVEVGTVIGFPLGQNTINTKCYEAIEAVSNGATEVDMVINIASLKDKDYEYVKEEIEQVRDSIDGKTLKVIIETNLLTKEEIIKMTEMCNETFVAFIKTGTGLNGPVKLEDVELISKHKNDLLEIKASGGIKDFDTLTKLIEAGATRIGTSNGEAIMNLEHTCCCEEHHE